MPGLAAGRPSALSRPGRSWSSHSAAGTTLAEPVGTSVVASAKRSLLGGSLAVRRVTTTLALALCVLGCTGEVKLLTARGPQGVHTCCVSIVSGLLLPDEEFGTVISVDGLGQSDGGGPNYETTEMRPVGDGRIVPVTWPEGYTGRQAGSEVQVLNASGEVVATTGRRYFCARHADGSWSACAAAEATGDAT